MVKYIKNFICNVLIAFIVSNLADILLILGCGLLVAAFFMYVSVFVGMIVLSIVLILFGIIVSKVR